MLLSNIHQPCSREWDIHNVGITFAVWADHNLFFNIVMQIGNFQIAERNCIFNIYYRIYPESLLHCTLPEHTSSSLVFSGVCVTRSLVLCVCFVDRCLYFFFWSLCCLFFFDIQILITPLVSPSSSFYFNVTISSAIKTIYTQLNLFHPLFRCDVLRENIYKLNIFRKNVVVNLFK